MLRGSTQCPRSMHSMVSSWPRLHPLVLSFPPSLVSLAEFPGLFLIYPFEFFQNSMQQNLVTVSLPCLSVLTSESLVQTLGLPATTSGLAFLEAV